MDREDLARGENGMDFPSGICYTLRRWAIPRPPPLPFPPLPRLDSRLEPPRPPLARFLPSAMDDDGFLQWLNIGALPRVAEFPFRVSTVGWVARAGGGYHGTHEGGLEFCLRLRSESPVAVDRFDGREWRTPYPHLVVERPGPLHEYEERELVEAFFFIYQPSMSPLLELAGVRFPEPVMPFALTSRLLRIVDFARAELFPRIAERGVADEIDALCWGLLSNLLAQRPAAEPRRAEPGGGRFPGVNAGDAVAQRLRAAEERMRLGFAEAIDFAALAREAGLSRRTFFRRWADVFRDTPQAHLREIRLLNAARGLVLDSRSVSEVAVSCGFPNPAYFSSLFRRRFGASPQRYRSQQLKTLGWRDYHGPIT